MGLCHPAHPILLNPSYTFPKTRWRFVLLKKLETEILRNEDDSRKQRNSRLRKFHAILLNRSEFFSRDQGHDEYSFCSLNFFKSLQLLYVRWRQTLQHRHCNTDTATDCMSCWTQEYRCCGQNTKYVWWNPRTRWCVICSSYQKGQSLYYLDYLV